MVKRKNKSVLEMLIELKLTEDKQCDRYNEYFQRLEHFENYFISRLQDVKKSPKSKSKNSKISKKRKSKTSINKKSLQIECKNPSNNNNNDNFPSVQYDIEWNITVGDVKRRRFTLGEFRYNIKST